MRAMAVCGILLSVNLGICIPSAHATGAAEVIRGNTEFAVGLYKQILPTDAPASANTFVSPYSISSALAMTLAGAEGNTAKEMSTTLHLPMDKTSTGQAFQSLNADINALAELSIANALWGQTGFAFLGSFTRDVAAYYDGRFQELDFRGHPEEARQEINAWVSQKTGDRIPELLAPGIIESLTRLILTNAIYFKADWQTKFKEENTRDEPFALLDGTYRAVPTMVQTDHHRYFRDEQLQVLELAYAEDDLAMLICLPHEPGGLPKLEQDLNPAQIDRWITSLEERKVKVFLPRFTIHDAFSLKEPLQKLGMRDAFTGIADFSAMTGHRDLYISYVIHKSFIEVNERGTEAAAATALGMATWGGIKGSETIPIFRADHAFLFLIRHKPTGSILFMGRLARPEGEVLPNHVPTKQPDAIHTGGMYR